MAASRRVLWSLAVAGAALAFAPAVPASAEGPASPVVAAATPKPGSAEQFVILNDGKVLSGPVTADAEKASVTVTCNGKAQVFPKFDVALAYGMKDGKRKRLHKGDDTGVYTAWSKWLDAEFLAKRGGVKFEAAETAPREAYRDAVIAALDQCGPKWRAYTAAGALLYDAVEKGAYDATLQEAALAAIPDSDREEGFPFNPGDDERPKLWGKWCKALIPQGGQFVNVKLHPRQSQINKDWKDNAIILRARNVELWSREQTPEKIAIVADTLNQAEATVRALESLLGTPETGSDEPLMVRLLENRQAYLQDIGPGGQPPQWSGGFFSPGDAISRFYVGGEMRLTVSHELTHHWLERRRFRGSGRAGRQPGHWIVEGFARFVEHQSHFFQKGNFTFANEGADSIRNCVFALRSGELFPVGDYINISAEDFHNKLAGDMNRLHMFYQQGGALVFFMMNKRGEDGRRKFIEYMRKQYAGEFLDAGPEDPYGQRKVDMEKAKPILDTYTLLGFKTAGEMDGAFTAWLQSLAK